MLTFLESLQNVEFHQRIFHTRDLIPLSKGNPAKCDRLVQQALALGELMRLRRGTYMVAPKYRTAKVSKFFVASQMVPNSYISFESALSYHGWIPERVVQVLSVISKGRPRHFETPLGDFEFEYVHLPVNELEFLSGVTREECQGQPFLMATPLRALADYVYDRKIKWTSIDWLLDGLRIEEENLRTLTLADFHQVRLVFRTKRVLSFLNGIQQELFATTTSSRPPRRVMIPNIIKDRFKKYAVQTVEEEEDALKEILQEIILQGLSHTDFFTKAVFHGGSCLRIVYHLPRFSEDLDFMLKQVNPNFTWQPYQKTIEEVCRQYGIRPEIKDKSKAGGTVQKMFLKDNSIGKFLELSFQHDPNKKITIKLEIDINPPTGYQTEVKFLDFPVDFPIEIQDLSSNFASKSHALLCRTYLKGRDWYDFLWYVKQEVSPNLDFLANALHQQGPWANQPIQVTSAWYINQLREKIQSIDWEMAKKDVLPFLRNSGREILSKWSVDLFLEELSKLSKTMVMQ